MPTRRRKIRAAEERSATPTALDLERAENLQLQRAVKACRQRCAEMERELGQILHDGVCQELSATAFYLQCLRNQLDRNKLDRVPKLMEQLSASVQKSVESAHALSQRLRKSKPVQ